MQVITGTPNLAPVANAGPDQSVTDDNADGVATVTLDASASTDADGLIVDYIWREGATILGTGAILNIPLAVGVHDILTKCIGSHNPHNLVKATIDGLRRLRSAKEIAAARGVDAADVRA